MTAISLPKADQLKKSTIFLTFFVFEMSAVAMLPLSYHSGWMPVLLPVHAMLTALLLLGACITHNSERYKTFSPVIYACFAIGAAILVSTLWHMDLVQLSGFSDETPQGISLAIFFQSLLRVLVALALMVAGGASRQMIYLQKGDLKLGLGAGTAGFLILASVAYFPVTSQVDAAQKLLSLSPWILLFVLSNGFAEELLFRGLILRQYEIYLGKGTANLLAAVVFTLLHAQVNYVPDLFQFLFGVFPLALLWGWLIQKTDSIWGSALFHAGADCLIIFSIFTVK